MAEPYIILTKCLCLGRKDCTKFVLIYVPEFAKGEPDIGGTNYRMHCHFCKHNFSSSKTRVFLIICLDVLVLKQFKLVLSLPQMLNHGPYHNVALCTEIPRYSVISLGFFSPPL